MNNARLFKAMILALIPSIAMAAETREFAVHSADGTMLHGQADLPSARPVVTVIFVPGSGPFDRDAGRGEEGTERDLFFRDLAGRMNAVGVATVRYDLRGIRHGRPPAERLDADILAGRTTTNMREDLAAIYDWTRSPAGLGARCIAFFAHSEGMIHLGRLASSGAPAPAFIIGMGAPMEHPRETIRWQLEERIAYSLELMDADRNGETNNEEIRANLSQTPAGLIENPELLFAEDGAWTAADIARLRTEQATEYQREMREALGHDDRDPYPNAAAPFASYQWWKSWFQDDRSVASMLSVWQTPIRLHYGNRDSQILAAPQIAAAMAFLPSRLVSIEIHAGRGHTLGDHARKKAMDSQIGDQIAREAAAASQRCR